MFADVFIYRALVPAVILGVILLLSQPPWRERTPLGAGWGLAIGIGAGFLAGWYGGDGLPEHVHPAVAVAILLGLVEFGLSARAGGSARADWLRWPLRVLVPAAVAWAMFGWIFQNVWETTGMKVSGAGAVVLGTAAMMGTFDEIARRRPGPTVPLAMWVLASGAAGYLLVAGSGLAAEMMGALAGMAGAAIAVAIVKGLWGGGALSMARGGAVVWTLLFALVFIAGHFGAFEPPWKPALLLILAPHILWIGELGPLGKMGGWKGTLVRFVLVAVAVGAAVAWARAVGGAFM